MQAGCPDRSLVPSVRVHWHPRLHTTAQADSGRLRSWAGSEAEGNLDGRQGPGDGRVELDQLGQGAREDGDDGGSLAGVAEVDAGIRRR